MYRILIFLIFLIFIFSGCSNFQQSEKPNIIIINIDDLGWQDLGFMGSEFYETPNIDALSERGIVFTNGYSAASNCSPSRACLMTGKWTTRHGVYTVGSSERGKSKDRKLIPTKNNPYLSNDFTIFPEILQKNGYSTCHAGKWHLTNNPKEKGFDVNIGGGKNGHPKSYYPPYGNVDLEANNGEYLTNLIMSKAIEFVKSANDPFFLYYSPYAVHTPIQPVDSLMEKYNSKPTINGQNNAAYASMIENLDRNIGLLISTLEKLELMKNTCIIFTSDNGGLYGVTNQMPIRAGKGSYYEGGIRVPFFFVWEGKFNAGLQNHIPITNLDIFPTILEIAGMKLNDFVLDGQSLWPMLTDSFNLEPRPLFWHFPIYLEAYNKTNNQNRDSLFRTRPGSVIRFGDWKLHHYYEDGGVELYNLIEDISEQQNLVDDYPKKVEELLLLLNHWREKTNAPIPKKI